MKRRLLVLLAVVAGVVAWLASSSSRPRVPVKFVPTDTVQVAPLRAAPVVNHLVAYGRVVAAPWAVHSLVEPFEVSVTRVLVNRGESVSKGARLLTLAPGPEARLALLQARSSYRLARLALREERMRVHLRLATSAGLLRAKRVFDQARVTLTTLQDEGLRNAMALTAPVGGLVSAISAREGASIAPGQPLMEIVAGDRLEVRLGIEPEDAPAIRVGERVRLSSFEGASQAHVHGLVSVIGRVMDPTTHMINVFVTLPARNPYLLGEYVEGRFTATSARGLVVARSAVVPAGHHDVLYTIADGRAVMHRVQIGARNKRIVQVIDPHLKAGMPAVVVGNYELKPGMPVRVTK